MIKPSFRLDDIKQYKTEGNIEPKVLAEYKVRPRYAEKGDRTFCIPEAIGGIIDGLSKLGGNPCPDYQFGDRESCSHTSCDSGHCY